MELIEQFFSCALQGVTRRDPGPYCKTAHECGCQGPDDWHPCFYGCWDWHSAVHSHFLLVRCLRHYPMSNADRALAVLTEHLTPERIAVEVESLFKEKEGWECPYGLAWVLRLAQELDTWHMEMSCALEPLEVAARDRLAEWLRTLHSPCQSGAHGNTAFALRLLLEHSRRRPRFGVEEETILQARELFQVTAPVDTSGFPFLSPLLTQTQFLLASWNIAEELPIDTWWMPEVASLLKLKPVTGNPHDMKSCHAIGLNFSRAEGLAQLSLRCHDHGEALLLLRSARHHWESSVPFVNCGGWMADHWVCTFGLMALEAFLHASSVLEPT